MSNNQSGTPSTEVEKAVCTSAGSPTTNTTEEPMALPSAEEVSGFAPTGQTEADGVQQRAYASNPNMIAYYEALKSGFKDELYAPTADDESRARTLLEASDESEREDLKALVQDLHGGLGDGELFTDDSEHFQVIFRLEQMGYVEPVGCLCGGDACVYRVMGLELGPGFDFGRRWLALERALGIPDDA